MRLLTPAANNTKMSKGGGLHDRFLVYILHLAPSTLSGKNLCPNASPGCVASCLNTAGRGVFTPVQKGRMRKSRLFVYARERFMADLFADLCAVLRKAKREGKKPVVRLNGTSDIPWEAVIFGEGKSIIDLFPEIQFYDYTKSESRMIRFLGYSQNSATWPSNYHLTFSRSETNDRAAWRVLDHGGSVALVFDAVPQRAFGLTVVSGDDHDLRFLDCPGSLIGLTAKGKAKKDQSGFVIRSVALRAPSPELSAPSPRCAAKRSP